MRKSRLFKLLAVTMCITMTIAMSACGKSDTATNTDEKAAEATADAAESDTQESDTQEADTAAADSGEKKVIGVTLNHTQDVFMKNLESGVLEAAKAHPEVEVKCVECGQDPAVQLSQVEQFIAEGVDMIVLNPANQEASADAIEEAVDAGIPIMTVNTTSTEEAQAKCLTYVGSDAKESGRIQGKYIAEEILKGKGKVAYIMGAMGHQAQIDRREGTLEIFEEYPDIEIVLEGTGNWNTEDSMSLAENWLNSGEEIDIIACQGADMAFGALLALEDAGKDGQIAVSGIDINDDTAEALKEGRIANLVFQDAIGQGQGGIEAAVEALNGTTLESYIDIPYELVTKDNVDDYAGRY